ncbi:hypothetical protein [Actinomadura sp. DC4]|uniref:phage tail tube protein n=1 Tax=Actinomadura sp. DC4 TaxID=3055069 RepID=UPI0025AED767|nr:hypothetical protein [Actinomadura sp. DC4]MDN3356085.1 hypothetical protein [Actinomadura sp. DC4]
MAATPIADTERFFAPEVTKIVFITELDDKTSPTRVEINGGLELSGEVSDASGWNVSSAQIDTPDYGKRFTGKIGGRTEVADSSLKMYQSQTTDDVRRVLPRTTRGYILIMWGGDIADQMMDVYPVEVLSNGKTIPDSAAADITIAFSITDEPVENVLIPAA